MEMGSIENATQKPAPHFQKVEWQSCSRKAGVFAAVSVDGWDHALRRNQLDDSDMGLFLQEVDAGEHPEWKDTAYCSPFYRRY